MDAVESSLVSISKVPANAGHTLHKGTPREAFIKEFLEGHLSSDVAIGTGELIDASSAPGSQRNQFDIVIYKRNYPKLDFGGGVSGFLIESVVATIEVKSLLNEAAIEQSVKAAHAAKSLTPNLSKSFSTGWIPPKVLNFVVAYSGPKKMATACSWIRSAHQKLGIPEPILDHSKRGEIPGTALDGAIHLESGFVLLDNMPITLNYGGAPGNYIICDSSSGNLLMLFLALQQACNNIHGAWLNPIPYLSNTQFQNVKMV
jgi:hypothetical protein